MIEELVDKLVSCMVCFRAFESGKVEIQVYLVPRPCTLSITLIV